MTKTGARNKIGESAPKQQALEALEESGFYSIVIKNCKLSLMVCDQIKSDRKALKQESD